MLQQRPSAYLLQDNEDDSHIELYDMVADPLFFTANGKDTVINRFGINFSQNFVMPLYTVRYTAHTVYAGLSRYMSSMYPPKA